MICRPSSVTNQVRGISGLVEIWNWNDIPPVSSSTGGSGGTSWVAGKSVRTEFQNAPICAARIGLAVLKSTPQITSTTGGLLKSTRPFMTWRLARFEVVEFCFRSVTRSASDYSPSLHILIATGDADITGYLKKPGIPMIS